MAVISIALVSATAAAIYYGGSAIAESREGSVAQAIVTQSSQIKAAYMLHRLEKGQAAASVQELVDGGYLKPISFPFEGSGSYGTVQGHWALEDWNHAVPGKPVYVLSLTGVNGKDEAFARICGLALRIMGITPDPTASAVDGGVVCKDEGGGKIYFEMHLDGSY